MSWPPRRRPPRRPRRTTGSIVGPEGTAYANRVRDVLRRGGVTSDGPDLPKKPRASEEATRTVVGRGRRSRPEPVPSALDGRVAMHGSLYARRRAAAGSSSRVGLPRSTELELLDAACPQRAMPLFRIPRVGDDSAHVVWKRPATGRRRRHAPRDPPSTSSTATTLPITCRVLRAGPSSPRRSRGSHAPLSLVAATSSRAPREQGRRRVRGGVREHCRSQLLHVFNRVRREPLGQTREGSDRVSTTRPQQSHSASPHPGLTTCRAV